MNTRICYLPVIVFVHLYHFMTRRDVIFDRVCAELNQNEALIWHLFTCNNMATLQGHLSKMQ